jgi:hypothetical protein
MALTRLKIAVFAPTPSASERIATAVMPGVIRIWRNADFKSRILLPSAFGLLSFASWRG